MNKTTTIPSHLVFNNWFKKQYGRLPNQRKRDKSRVNAVELEAALRQAKINLQREDALLSAWNDALYGWNARKS